MTLQVVSRTRWEQPGYSIAEHTTSPPVDPRQVDKFVHHYGATKGRLRGTPEQFLANIQKAWADQRGYSIGYGWLTWPGRREVWEIRGWTFRNAANAVNGDDGRTNLTSVAVLHALPGLALDPNGYAVDELDDDQLAAVHGLTEHITEVCGRNITVTSHGRLEPTGCPGIGIARQLAAGKLNLPAAQPAPSATLLTTVQPGDGWWSIARRVYGAATPALVDVLANANGRRAIHPGQHITVPGRATYP